VWGPPKCGKSFWAFTVTAAHVATGREYRGRRVRQAEVVYIALEGQSGFGKRRDALRERYLQPGETVPAFKLCGATLNLIKDHQELIADIRAQSSAPGCIVIDTMNRSLVGSEGKDEDMAAYLRAAQTLEKTFGCLVIIIHHCGVDETRPRGHSSQTGAADVQISVKKDAAGIITTTVELAKDMAEGVTILSRLVPVELGFDQEGDPITTCVVLPVEDGEIAKPERKRKKKLAPSAATALRALKEAIADTGIMPPASDHVPTGIRGVTKDQWRDYASRLGICTDSGREAKTSDEAEKLLREAQRKAFARGSGELIAAGQVGCWNDFFWFIKD
jgi:hypothetical protein